VHATLLIRLLVYSVKLHLRQTDGQTKRLVSSSVRPSVRSYVSFFRCVCQGRPSYGGTNREACFIEI